MNSGPDLNTVISQAQQNVKNVCEWLKEQDMDVHPQKCQVMYCNNSKKDPDKKVKINGQPMEWSHQIKYLGIIIDKGLTFSQHFDQKVTKNFKKLWMFKTAIGRRWGPNPKLTLYMYTHIIIPSILYACFIWAHQIKGHKQKRFKKLNSLALRMTAPMHKSTPTSGLEALLGVEPLDIIAKNRSISTIMRIGQPKPLWDGKILYANGNVNNNRVGFYRHWDQLVPKTLSGPIRPISDKCVTYFNWTPEKFLTWTSSDPAKAFRKAGAKNPYFKGVQLRIHVLSKDSIESAKTREVTSGDPLEGNICVGYRILMDCSSNDPPIESRVIDEKLFMLRNETGKENAHFYAAAKALKFLETKKAKLLSQECEIIIFAEFNRKGLKSPMIKQLLRKCFLQQCKIIVSRTNRQIIILKPTKCYTRHI